MSNHDAAISILTLSVDVARCNEALEQNPVEKAAISRRIADYLLSIAALENLQDGERP